MGHTCEVSFTKTELQMGSNVMGPASKHVPESPEHPFVAHERATGHRLQSFFSRAMFFHRTSISCGKVLCLCYTVGGGHIRLLSACNGATAVEKLDF